MNNLLNAMKNEANVTYTTNGARAYKSTKSALLDMFARCGSMRQASEDDCILLFSEAYDENPEYAMKCLFWCRDVRGGAGERRFFRVVMRWLAQTSKREAAKRNLEWVSEYGRYDDLYAFVGTPLETDALDILKKQIRLDLQCETPSLCGKWLKSINASSKETNRLGEITRKHFGMTQRQYRKMLAALRTRINVLEKLMSENRWDEIQFDKIPSKAGLIYKNAFARRDIIKAKYEKFAKDTTTTVNAGTLYPYEVVQQAIKLMNPYGGYWRTSNVPVDNVDRLMINKYWENIPNVLKDANLNALVMCDTSGSMLSCGHSTVKPMDVAVSLAIYCAERANGPFKNHYISFASEPKLIEVKGIDFCDKVNRIVRTNLCDNTNLMAAFDMLLDTAVRNKLSQDDLPEKIVVISDMQIDGQFSRSNRIDSGFYIYGRSRETDADRAVEMEKMRTKWRRYGYTCPEIVYWNVNAKDATFLDNNPTTTYVSGFSQNIFNQLMTGLTGYDMMMATLSAARYDNIH